MWSFFGRQPRCPIDADVQQWIDTRFLWLEMHLGKDTPRTSKVILPTPEFFPDRFDADLESAQRMLVRIARYMRTDASRLVLSVYADPARPHAPREGHFSYSYPAGLYHHAPAEMNPDGPVHIGIEHSKLREPMALAATLAHEVGHHILLGRELIEPDAPDHEPLTDLLTVFLGMGIFPANATIHDRGFTSGMWSGWQTGRLGYLDQRMFGYALARFALARGERKPAWMSHIRLDVRSPMKASIAYLRANPPRPQG